MPLWLLNLLKKKETKMADVPRIDIPRAEVERVKVDRFDYLLPKPNTVEPTVEEWKEPKRTLRSFRVRYDDTGDEIIVDPNNKDEYDKLFDSGRPVTILGFAD